MSGENPGSWLGRRVKVYLFQAGTPDVDELTTNLQGIEALGITVNAIPGPGLTFYPWTAVRQIDHAPGEGGGQRQTRPQQQQVDPGSLTPTFPQVRM